MIWSGLLGYLLIALAVTYVAFTLTAPGHRRLLAALALGLGWPLVLCWLLGLWLWNWMSSSG